MDLQGLPGRWPEPRKQANPKAMKPSILIIIVAVLSLALPGCYSIPAGESKPLIQAQDATTHVQTDLTATAKDVSTVAANLAKTSTEGKTICAAPAPVDKPHMGILWQSVSDAAGQLGHISITVNTSSADLGAVIDLQKEGAKENAELKKQVLSLQETLNSWGSKALLVAEIFAVLCGAAVVALGLYIGNIKLSICAGAFAGAVVAFVQFASALQQYKGRILIGVAVVVGSVLIWFVAEWYHLGSFTAAWKRIVPDETPAPVK